MLDHFEIRTRLEHNSCLRTHTSIKVEALAFVHPATAGFVHIFSDTSKDDRFCNISCLIPFWNFRLLHNVPPILSATEGFMPQKEKKIQQIHHMFYFLNCLICDTKFHIWHQTTKHLQGAILCCASHEHSLTFCHPADLAFQFQSPDSTKQKGRFNFL